MRLGVWLKFFSRNDNFLHCGRQIRIDALADAGQDRCAQHFRVALDQTNHFFPQNIGDDLVPDFTRCCGAADPQLLNINAIIGFKKLYDMPDGKSGAFQHRPKEIIAIVAQGNTEKHPAGIGVPDGGSLSGNVRQK